MTAQDPSKTPTLLALQRNYAKSWQLLRPKWRKLVRIWRAFNQARVRRGYPSHAVCFPSKQARDAEARQQELLALNASEQQRLRQLENDRAEHEETKAVAAEKAAEAQLLAAKLKAQVGDPWHGVVW